MFKKKKDGKGLLSQAAKVLEFVEFKLLVSI